MKEYGTRPPLKKQIGVRPEAQDFNPNHDDQGRFGSGSGGAGGSGTGGLANAPTIHGGFKYSAGERVKITGSVKGQGKTGRIGEASPSGHFFSVVDRQGNHIGYYHESDLSPVRGG